MRSIGGLLFFFGLGSVVLELFNYQFAILAPIEEYQPAAGIILAVIGAVLVGVGVQQEQTARRRAEAEMAAMAPAATAAPMATSDASMASTTPAAGSSWSSTPTTPSAPDLAPAPDVAAAPVPPPDVAAERSDPERPA